MLSSPGSSNLTQADLTAARGRLAAEKPSSAHVMLSACAAWLQPISGLWVLARGVPTGADTETVRFTPPVAL